MYIFVLVQGSSGLVIGKVMQYALQDALS